MPLIKVSKCPNCDGKSHEWEFKAPGLKEIREVVETKAGQTVQEFLQGIEDYNGQSLTALLFLLHKRIGVDLRWNEVDVALEDLDMESLPDEDDEVDETKDETEAAGKEPPTEADSD